MGTEDWVLEGTKLITNTKKQRLKILSRGYILKNIKKKNTSPKNKTKTKQKKKKTHKGTEVIKYIYIYI